MGRKVVGSEALVEVEEVQQNQEPEVVEDYEKSLKAAVEQFFDINSKAKELDTRAKALNAEIKGVMLTHGLKTFDFDDYKVKCTTVESCSFDPDILLAVIKDSGKKELIKTREYVDLDDLEQAVYKEEIDAAILAPAQKISEQVRLSVTCKAKKG